MIQAHHNGPYYFVWHQPCSFNSHKPVRCSATRRPIIPCSKWSLWVEIWENIGSYHPKDKRLSSRRVRRALKREDNATWQEQWEDYCVVQKERFFTNNFSN